MAIYSNSESAGFRPARPFQTARATKRAFLLLLAFALILTPLAAQQYIAQVEHYGVEQGLSHRQVNTMCKDRRGFLWIGTPSGLNRFDGHTFRWYTKNRDGLPFDDIQTIHLDSQGWLWVFKTDFTGLFLFQPETGEIKTREQLFGTAQLPFEMDYFWSVLSSPFSDKLLFRFNGAHYFYTWCYREGWRKITVQGISNFFVEALSPDGTYWGVRMTGGHGDMLCEVDSNGTVLRRFPGKKWSSFGAEKDFVIANEPDRQNYFHIGNGEQFEPILRSIPEIPGVTAWPVDGGIIISSAGKIYHLLDGALLYDLGEKCNRPRCVYTDYNGTVWMGGDFGLYLLSIKHGKFRNVFHEKLNTATNFGVAVRGIAVQDHRVYVNLESGGFWELDRNTLSTRLIAKHAMERSQPSELAYFAVFADPSTGDVYSGASESLLRYSPATGAIKRWMLPWDKQVWAIGRVAPGVLLLGGGGFRIQQGLFLLDENKGAPVAFEGYNGYNELKNATIQTIKTDRSGQIWLCASTGLYKFDLARGITDRYWSKGTADHFLPADNVQHFYEDADGTFWIGTAYEGLLHWNPRSGECSKITRAEGLSNNNIYAVYEDALGRLWLPSDYGLMQLDKKTGHVKAWVSGDGIAHDEFNRLAHAQAPDGQLFFGGLNGLTLFQPADFYDHAAAAEIPLELSDCTVFNGALNKSLNKLTEVWATNTLRLLPDDANFNLSFALLNFEKTGKTLYAWKIDGRDEDWHFQKENQISMGRLPYGEYTLRLRGQAADGQWSQQEKTLRIVVVRPFYATWWFFVLLIGLAALAIRGYIRWRTREQDQKNLRLEKEVDRQTATIRRQSEELQRIDVAKSRFFANVSHELRTPLTLMLGPVSSLIDSGELTKRNLSHARLIQQNSQHLLKLVGEILDLQKLESGKLELRPKATLLYPTLKRIAAQFESLAQTRSVEFIFRYKAEKHLQIEVDASKLELVLNNLLSNAIKFTPAGGRVEVTAEDLAHSIRLSVTDTGRGIHPDDLPRVFDRFFQTQQPETPTEGGTGIGLSLVKELSVLFSGSISAQSPVADDKGARFVFEFPKVEVMGAPGTPAEHASEGMGYWQPEAEPATGTAEVMAKPLPSILLVEDNPDLRSYVKTILSNHYHIITVENGQQALNCLAAGEAPCAGRFPDLIISDIMMPVMDGFQLLQKLKSDEHLRQIPVIMLTARADMQDKLRALRIGVDDYLIKPFVEEELLVRISALLERYAERQQQRSKDMEPAGDEANAGPIPGQRSESDNTWLTELETLIAAEVQNDQISVSWIADRLHLSERTFQRRLKILTGLSPNAYIKEVRLQEARRVLEQGRAQSVKQVAWLVSFRDEKYFAQIFRERFGKYPSEMMR